MSFILYTYNKSSIKDGLIALYEFNETSGTTIYDAIGTNNGTIANGVLVNQTGKLNKCVYFPTKSSAPLPLVTTQNKIFSELPISLSMWARGIENASSRINGFHSNYRTDGSYSGINVYFQTANDSSQRSLFLYCASGVGTARRQYQFQDSGGTWFRDNSFYFIVVTIPSFIHNEIGVYVNNVKFEPYSQTFYTDYSVDFSQGQSAFTRPQGLTTTRESRLDQCAFWNRLLTEDEIEYLYNEGNGREYINWI